MKYGGLTMDWKNLKIGEVLSYGVDEFDGPTREVCVVTEIQEDVVICTTKFFPGGDYKLCIDHSNSGDFKRAVSIENYCKYMGFPEVDNFNDLIKIADKNNVWLYSHGDREEAAIEDTVLVYDKKTDTCFYFECAATPIGLQQAATYYEVNDGFFTYYIHSETGQKKFELDKGDVLIERNMDDFTREEV